MATSPPPSLPPSPPHLLVRAVVLGEEGLAQLAQTAIVSLVVKQPIQQGDVEAILPCYLRVDWWIHLEGVETGSGHGHCSMGVVSYCHGNGTGLGYPV